MDRGLKMVDLFAGAGGLTLGFFQNGIEIIDTIEFDSSAVDTYNFNFKTDVVPRNITDKQVKEAFIKNNKKNTDILIGGFPCQGFSMAGLRDPKDPRNKLYLDTIDIIKGTNPEVIVLENVKGLMSMEKGKRIKTIINDLNDAGYYCEYILLNSSNFGVPQNRERVIFIGAKPKNKKNVSNAIEELSKIKISKKTTVKDAIEDLVTLGENKDFNHTITKHSDDMTKRLSVLEEGQSLYEKYKDAWKRVYWNSPSPTVKENHGATCVHPKLNRVMTVRELARLQSFPDDFIFQGSKSSQLRQVGNAVPVKMSNEISKIVKKHFFENNGEKGNE